MSEEMKEQSSEELGTEAEAVPTSQPMVPQQQGILLQPIGIFKGSLEQGIQYFYVSGTDTKGTILGFAFGCHACYTNSVIKALSRLFPINVPEEQGESTNEHNSSN